MRNFEISFRSKTTDGVTKMMIAANSGIQAIERAEELYPDAIKFVIDNSWYLKERK